MTDQEIVGQARSLSGLVQVQSGAVVSRTLVKNSNGNATLFAFDAAQGLSEHTTPHDALVVCIEGLLEIQIAGEAHQVAGGEALLMPSDQPHALHAAEATRMLLVMIRDN